MKAILIYVILYQCGAIIAVLFREKAEEESTESEENYDIYGGESFFESREFYEGSDAERWEM